MDPATITAAGTFLVAAGGAVGTAVAFFIKRADRRREANEALLIAHLTEELRQRDAELRQERKLRELREKDGLRWWRQLVAAGETPEPAEWTPLPEGYPNV